MDSFEEGIEGADNFLFFISPASVQSEYCLKELAHALKYHKRIIPLLIADTPVINHETHEKNPDENFRVFRDFRGSNFLIPEEIRELITASPEAGDRKAMAPQACICGGRTMAKVIR